MRNGNKMKIYIDADGCPVTDIAVRNARKYSLDVIILCDTSHIIERDGAKTITVSKGADSADFALVNMLQSGDLAITQDYGLAAMCLSKGALAINQDGRAYSSENIDGLLFSRYEAKKARMSGKHLKSIPKRVRAQDEAFESALIELIENSQKTV